MMRFSAFLLLIIPFFSTAQTGDVTVTVTDELTKQTVPSARVALTENIKGMTDLDGNITFAQVNYGKYRMMVFMSLYDTMYVNVEVKKPVTLVSVALGGSLELEELKVIGNLVTDRKTPVAVTKITPQKIAEELGSRDIPMLLNATPGVYATQQGGGDGDARITVRGFDQRNVGVMIDGVPVNDMENGAVYWSNWFGLDAITSNIQIQRGLGATKLAMPSVGGTINILTAGIGSRKGLSFKQEYGTGNFLRSTLSYNSGMLKNGFGFTASGSYKQGDGWVYGTPTQGAFYYLKVQKKLKNHLVSLSGFGAPQQHGQRSFNQRVEYWDRDRAEEMGIPITSSVNIDKGIRFNEHWGYITRNGKQEMLNERRNYYHKPQITLKDFWQVNKKLSISNLVYTSIGRGGGTKLLNYGDAARTEEGTIDWDKIVYNNQYISLFGTTLPNTDAAYDPNLLKSNQVLTSSVNNHFWMGYLGQFTYELSKKWSFSGGLDYRNYKGEHYKEIKDLLGGDYHINVANKNQVSPMLRVGDKIANVAYENHRDGYVQWAGVFGQAEYSGTRWTAFLNLSGVYNGYKGVDYFQKKVLDLGDTVLRLGYADTINYNGQTYTSSSNDVKDFETSHVVNGKQKAWMWIPGGTIKAGASYILTEQSTIFVNAGYLSRTPTFNNVIDNNTNTFFYEIKNEIIQALEAGYSFANNVWGINVNGYATNWKNKPFPFGVPITDPTDPTSTIYVNLNGMDALHLGAEVDMAWQITKKLSSEVMLSYGDWTWRSAKDIFIPQLNLKRSFDAKGVHVGDAAQSVYSAAVRYEPFKRFYMKLQYMYFDRYYAQFDPFSLNGANAGHESYKLPGYGIFNLFMGYKYKMKKADLLFNGGIQNLLNSSFIGDARDNQFGNNFDAASAGVMFGQGFRFNLSAGIQF